MGCGHSASKAAAANCSTGPKPGTAQCGHREKRRRNDYQRDPTNNGEDGRADSVEEPLPLAAAGSPVPLRSNRPVMVALYDFRAAMEGDLSFRQGDLLEIVDRQRDNTWLRARLVGSDRQGHVPCNYLKERQQEGDTHCLQDQEWFLGKLTRKGAERLLTGPGLTTGAFLVRTSSNTHNALVLSLRGRSDPLTGEIKISHYKIEKNSDGSCFMAHNRTFPNCIALVEHYKVFGEGLGQRLGEVCPRDSLMEKAPSTLSVHDKWEVDRQHLTFDKKLGHGQFARCGKGKYRRRVDVAIKTLKPGSMCPSKFLEEARLMKLCRHDKLVTLYAVCSQTQPFYIVTELMVHGSLLNYLRNGPGQNLPLVCLVDMASQVASGMSYLESQKLIHRDLAARNVLVGNNNMVKVADFGLARAIVDGEYNPHEGAKFPIKWTAPEAALYGKFSVKSDVWSYGILLHEILTWGQSPYPGMNNREVLEQVDLGYRMRKSPSTPDPVYNKMLRCWHKHPAMRPTFQHLYDFFEDYFTYTEDGYSAPQEQ